MMIRSKSSKICRRECLARSKD